DELLPVLGVRFAGALPDRAFDRLLRHGRDPRLVECQPQTRIAVRGTAALARGDREHARQLGEGLGALAVDPVLAKLDVRGVGVTSHERTEHTIRNPAGLPQCNNPSSSPPAACSSQRLLNCVERRALCRPYFFRSTSRESRVSRPLSRSTLSK